MLRFSIRRGIPLIVMCALLTLMILHAALNGKSFAQAAGVSHTDCSMRNALQPLSCLPASVQTSLRMTGVSHQNTQTRSALTVQQVEVADVTGNSQTSFVPGEIVIYAAFINNTSGNPITASFNFAAPGSSTECKFDLAYTGQTIPTGQSTWTVLSDLCGDENAATYTLKVFVQDQSNSLNQSHNQATFTVNADNLPYPSFWNNKLCDTNDYSGSFQLKTANYRNEPACGPRPNYDSPYKDVKTVYFGDTWGEYEWECVELSMRFMYMAYGVPGYSAHGNEVVNNYTNSQLDPHSYNNHVLVPVPNNGAHGSLPYPGDILSYNFVHTSVVLADDVNGNTGTGPIYVLEQNASVSGIGTINVKNWSIPGIQNWLHHTLNMWPQTAAPGASVLMSGTGLSPNQSININFGGNLTPVTTDSNGNFATTLTVPQLSSGQYTISVVPSGTTTPYSQTVFYVN